MLKFFKRWSNSSLYFQHQYLLLLAEKSRLEGKIDAAASYYEQAIESAAQGNYIQDEAIAYKLAGNFSAKQGNASISAFYERRAYNLFQNWGAKTIIQKMKSQYPILAQEKGPLETTLSTLNVVQTSVETSNKMTSDNAIITNSTYDVDVNAIIDASQNLSRETDLDKLVKSIMRILFLSAGANRATLILQDQDQLYIQAEISKNLDNVSICHIPLDEKEEELCIALVKFVAKSKKNVLLNNAMKEGDFTNSPYILANKPKSILCIPILHKEALKGIIYLENVLTTGAFTPRHLHILSVLSSQMAISLENTLFRLRLEGEIRKRTHELHQKNIDLEETFRKLKLFQNQMVQQEKLASLGLLTSGIAQELKQPLNTVIEFSQTSRDLIETIKKENVSKPSHDELIKLMFKLKSYITKLDIHGKRADAIIKGMLKHARHGPTKSEVVDVNMLLNQGITHVQEEYQKKEPNLKINIIKKYNSLNQLVEAFPGDLIRVFVNIMDNAFYFLNEKLKKISDFEPALVVQIEENMSEFKIIIEDNGPGIPEEELNKLFEPFFSTKPEGMGSGLGLSIAHDIVTKQHGGHIEVQSKLGSFTRFTIGIPKKILSEI